VRVELARAQGDVVVGDLVVGRADDLEIGGLLTGHDRSR
jgi:hypothetical protein